MGERKRCSCGRFYVRRYYLSTVVKYKTPKGGNSNYRLSVPKPDGLCERCAIYGPPEATGMLSHYGAPIKATMQRGKEAMSLRALQKVAL